MKNNPKDTQDVSQLSLSKLSNDELVSKLKDLVSQEKKLQEKIKEKVVEIRFNASPEFMKLLNEFKAQVAEEHPDPTYAEIFELLTDMYLEKHDPTFKAGKNGDILH